MLFWFVILLAIVGVADESEFKDACEIATVGTVSAFSVNLSDYYICI